jgi:D-ribose pyranose/furanose isomerase RbsD
VLDEATSNIDAEAEKSIQDALRVLIRGRTTIAIAHRLSTLRHADRILVFDQGRLIEQGSHAELLAMDGTYARLVRIQTSVTKNPDIDKLIHAATEIEAGNRDSVGKESNGSESKGSDSKLAIVDGSSSDDAQNGQPRTGSQVEDGEESQESNGPVIRWMDPSSWEFRRGDLDRIELWSEGVQQAASTFVVRTFPSKYPEGYLSVRTWGENGEEVECGMIRSLDGWAGESAELARELLARRYLMRRIVRVRKNQLESGYLNLEVETDQGPEKFTMRWTSGQALDYSDNGKLLIDTRENRYVVEDIDLLPSEDRERFLQYIYW